MNKYIKYDTALRYIKDAGMRIGGVWGIEATAHFEHEPTIEIPPMPKGDMIGYKWKLKWVLEPHPTITKAQLKGADDEMR